MVISDRELIENYKKGNKESFSVLYDKYVDKIFKFIYFKTSHRETAEDLCSQTFIKALEKLNDFGFNNNTYFSAWLYTIARNNVIDHYRKSNKSKNNLNIDDVWDVSDDTDILSDVEFKLKTESIAKYIKKLNSEQREIIMLKIFEELSYKEISEILDKNEGACKMSFCRAIKKLRKEMPLLSFISLFLIKL